ncbi:MAG: DUF512 domain-containing protein [Clostridia bacterium]|nr:DUF512 domain-containing protein [Clostridia bacterium]
MLSIKSVQSGSIAEELGFETGDGICACNGYPVSDFIDLLYIDGEENLNLSVCTKDGEKVEIEIEKDAFEPLGIEIAEEDRVHSCKNKCAFCFIDQLPCGMRESLYVKDDDWRYSLLCGNYVTLTNVTKDDIDRICRYKISPLYVSVHASDEKVRKELVKNPNTAKLFDYLERFERENIKFHAQIVMCKGINDGKVLEQTLSELKKFQNLLSVAVVPVGLTEHRQGLFPLKAVDTECAKRAIEITEKAKKDGLSVWCSDEMYLKADLEIPEFEYYEDFPQYENGVGMIAKFRRDFELGISSAVVLSGSYAVVTGMSAYPEIKKASNILMDKNKELNIEVYPIENNFFGKSITVAGLVTGADIIAQLKGKNIPETVLIPAVMLKEFENVFLDGVTTEKLAKELERKVVVVDTSGESFAQMCR